MRTAFLLLSLGCLLPATSHAVVHEFTPVRDTTIYSDADLANGSGTGMFAGGNGRGTLRRGLIAFDLSSISPGLEVVSGYWPATDDTTVGGDFYDVFAIDDRRWGVVIGDVCGKGVDAAALTALTRHTIRAAARHVSSPAGVLRWAHEAIEAAHHGATYATA